MPESTAGASIAYNYMEGGKTGVFDFRSPCIPFVGGQPLNSPGSVTCSLCSKVSVTIPSYGGLKEECSSNG